MKPLSDYLPELKKIEGYPIGEDKDILVLSDPPYYTACPNPYIADFIKEHGKPYDELTDNYHREPFIGDIAEGKRHPYYMVHSYHTKVPHKAIIQYIEHYTNEGDVILDLFCGSGMTSLAAQNCKRKSIIGDLSPAATFISYNYNTGLYQKELLNEISSIIEETENDLNSLFILPNGDKINYLIWSESFECPICNSIFSFWDVFVDKKTEEFNESGICPSCKAINLKKSNLKKVLDHNIPLLKPVYASIFKSKSKYKRALTESEIQHLLDQEKSIVNPYFAPINDIPEGYNLNQPKKSHNYLHTSDFYFNSSLAILSKLWYLAQKSSNRRFLSFFVSSLLSMRCTKRMPYRPKGLSAGSVNNLSIPSLIQQYSPLDVAKRKLSKNFKKAMLLQHSNDDFIITTQSSTELSNIPSNSIDFIFTDPPFGKNIMYSDMNFIWESWLKVFTNIKDEAIVNNVQNKEIEKYQYLLTSSFNELYRVLKPKRWITVEFNNKESSIWNAIHESIIKSGFIISQVSVFDKKMGSYKQVSSPMSVDKDLIITAYKPDKEFEIRFLKQTGHNMEIDYIKQFLGNLPKRPCIERTEKMLYRKMLTFYLLRGYEVNYDSDIFYKMLNNYFHPEDGFWFNSDQINSYREFKMSMKLEGLQEIKQGTLMMFIVDENSALAWMYNFLSEPKSFSDVSTAFNKLSEIQGDKVPELQVLLDDNFVNENNKYRLPKSDSEKSKISEKRERALLREFESLLLEAGSSKKKIQIVRKEAINYGFEVCYKQNRFEDIITLSSRLDKSILENSSELSEFFDISRIKVEGIK